MMRPGTISKMEQARFNLFHKQNLMLKLNLQSDPLLLKITLKTPASILKVTHSLFHVYLIESVYRNFKVCYLLPFCCMNSFSMLCTDVVFHYYQKLLLWVFLATFTRKSTSETWTSSSETLQKPPCFLSSTDHQIWAIFCSFDYFTKTTEALLH